MQTRRTRYIVFIGMFAAISTVLYFFEFPVIPGISYLQYDFSDIPAAIAAVMFGPLAGIAVEFIKNFFHVIIKGFGQTMGYGDLMNFIVGSALVVPLSIIMRFSIKKSFNNYAAALLAGIAGTACTVVFGVAGNYLIAPFYFEFFMHAHIGGAVLWGYIGGASILNVVKGAALTAVFIPFSGMTRNYMSAKGLIGGGK